ncbi:MAG: AMP-binding protein [Gammaproteobacteria bacterium]|nr:AMP-binding protein [Gammaproteobacteria bacterium]
MAGEEFVLSALVARHAVERPAAVAIDSVEDGALTWRELHEFGLAWAGVLKRVGVRRGDCVLSMIPTGHAAYAAWLGAAAVGACDVHVNHALIGRSLGDVVETTGARVAFIDSGFLERWKPMLQQGLEALVVVDAGPFDNARIHSLEDLLKDSLPLPHEIRQKGEDLACVIFTSGTTGSAKGVMLPWNAWSFAHSRAGAVPRPLRQDKVAYVPFSLAHYSGRFPLYAAASEGIRICTRRQFKTDHWLGDIRSLGAQWTSLLGGMGRFLLNTAPKPDDADNPLEFVIAAPVFPGVDEFRERFGIKDVYTSYGQSEITVVFSSAGAYEVSEETMEYCGVPSSSVEVELLDEQGQAVPAGLPGEMVVRPKDGTLSVGYLNNPQATASTFRDGWIHTGDLFSRSVDGRYRFVDRKKDYLRRRGENISSFEVEREVLAYPPVRECAVYGISSEFTEDEVMVAIVVDPERWTSPETLIDFLRDRLPSFSIPRYVELFESLPKTATERVQKVQLRERGLSATTWDRMAKTTDVRRGLTGRSK